MSAAAPGPVITRLANPEEVSQTAAREFVRLAAEAIALRGRFTVALAGGSTPKRMYQLLSEAPYRDQVNWLRVEFFWGDERSVPPDHADSNFRMSNEALLSKLPICSSQIHRMQGEHDDIEQAAMDYQIVIARVFGVSQAAKSPPAFDLILMGMGPDGHTLSLFPRTTALDDDSAWVAANWVEKFKTHRLTLTAKVCRRALHRMFCIAGEDKAAVLAEVLEGPEDTARLPTQLVLAGCGQTTLLVDHAAAARLTKSIP
jgi:6-phosphogluconolactonase